MNDITTPAPEQADEDQWVIEPAEPEVGIFSDSIVHECAANGTDDEWQEAEIASNTQRTENGVVTFTTVFRCPADGAEYPVTESWAEDVYFETGPGGDE